ncbi:MAG TPA: EcsC family protein, partial [Chitinophagaceae bacterium]
MNAYDESVSVELRSWQKKMLKRPSLLNGLSKRIQKKINSWIPEKVHNAITVTIKQMIRGVLFGAKHTTSDVSVGVSLRDREDAVRKKIDTYRNTAAIEGGITGAGG